MIDILKRDYRDDMKRDWWLLLKDELAPPSVRVISDIFSILFLSLNIGIILFNTTNASLSGVDPR